MPYRILARLIACVVGWYSATMLAISIAIFMRSTPLPRVVARMNLRANLRRHSVRGIRNMFRLEFLRWISLVSSRFRLYKCVLSFLYPSYHNIYIFPDIIFCHYRLYYILYDVVYL